MNTKLMAFLFFGSLGQELFCPIAQHELDAVAGLQIRTTPAVLHMLNSNVRQLGVETIKLLDLLEKFKELTTEYRSLGIDPQEIDTIINQYCRQVVPHGYKAQIKDRIDPRAVQVASIEDLKRDFLEICENNPFLLATKNQLYVDCANQIWDSLELAANNIEENPLEVERDIRKQHKAHVDAKKLRHPLVCRGFDPLLDGIDFDTTLRQREVAYQKESIKNTLIYLSMQIDQVCEQIANNFRAISTIGAAIEEISVRLQPEALLRHTIGDQEIFSFNAEGL